MGTTRWCYACPEYDTCDGPKDRLLRCSKGKVHATQHIKRKCMGCADVGACDSSAEAHARCSRVRQRDKAEFFRMTLWRWDHPESFAKALEVARSAAQSGKPISRFWKISLETSIRTEATQT